MKRTSGLQKRGKQGFFWHTLGSVFLLSGLDCNADQAKPEASGESARSSPSASLSADVSASALSAASASPPKAPVKGTELRPIASRRVPVRVLPDGNFIGEFSFQRDAGDEGLVWMAALDHCIGREMHLCTSSQWQSACEADPSLAELETWTMTPEKSAGFVVRGGAGDCKQKRVSLGIQSSPFRAAACCSSAIVSEGRGISQTMLKAMAKNVLDFERTLNQHRASALRGWFDEKVRLFTADKTAAEAVAIFEHELSRSEDYYLVHELCDFAPEAGNETYSAECRKIIRQGGKIGFVSTRYVFLGGSGKVRSIVDTAFYRPFLEP